jgi:hypothetical protein
MMGRWRAERKEFALWANLAWSQTAGVEIL